jgi:ABC-type multidrug transport system fused ATPase/permease subunit
MLYRRFEQLIDVFRDAPTASPPDRVLPFYTYYLKQVWPSFAALLTVGLFGALIEVALFSYLSRIIDLAQGAPNPNFFHEHGLELAWMAVVALILRPVFVGLHDLLVHQTLSPSMTSMIRWQNHSYVLKQSLNFFQNDFAGRIAQRIMQTGNSLRDSAVQAVDALWHVLIYAISSLVLFAEADWRLMIPLLTWIAAYIGALCYFVPRVKERSVVSSDARSKLMGRIVDGYTNIATLKLFAHTNYEQQYAREAIEEQTEKAQLAGQHGHRHYHHERPADRRHHGPGLVAVDAITDHRRGDCPGNRPGDTHRQYVRLDHVGGHRHFRKHRHGPGRFADHLATGQRHRSRTGQTAGCSPGRSAFRARGFSLRHHRRSQPEHQTGRKNRLDRAVGGR